jgi:hypothetical protein
VPWVGSALTSDYNDALIPQAADTAYTVPNEGSSFDYAANRASGAGFKSAFLISAGAGGADRRIRLSLSIR